MVQGTRVDGEFFRGYLRFQSTQSTARPIPSRAAAPSDLGHRCRAHQSPRCQCDRLPERATRTDQQEIRLWRCTTARGHHQRDPRRLQEGPAAKAQGPTHPDGERRECIAYTIRNASTDSAADRCRRCDVQTAPMSPYRHDGEHMRVSTKTTRCKKSDLTSLRSYCPGGPDSDFDYSTQSYTGYEPTSMRAIRARYDPYEQTRGRVEQLKSLGHSVDKVCASRAMCHWDRSRRCALRSSLSSWAGRS